MSVEGWQWQSTWLYLLKIQKQFKHVIWNHVWVVDIKGLSGEIEAVSRPWFSQGLLEWLMSYGPASPTMAVYLQNTQEISSSSVQKADVSTGPYYTLESQRGRLYCCWSFFHIL